MPRNSLSLKAHRYRKIGMHDQWYSLALNLFLVHFLELLTDSSLFKFQVNEFLCLEKHARVKWSSNTLIYQKKLLYTAWICSLSLLQALKRDLVMLEFPCWFCISCLGTLTSTVAGRWEKMGLDSDDSFWEECC